jgi:hypothetical protein
MSTQPDEIIHQSLRLKIMAALHAEPQGEALEFSRLKPSSRPPTAIWAAT